MIEQEKAATFKTIFGDDWDKLPAIMKKHYANAPYSDDKTCVTGHLDIMSKGPIKLLSPILRLLKGIPPVNLKNVKVDVQFKSDIHTADFHFLRHFHFTGKKTYIFHSRMRQIDKNVVAEIMPYRLAWLMSYSYENGHVILRHKGYALFIFNKFIPIPLSILIGKGYAKETPIDENSFRMETNITHKLWGKVYEYKGVFKLVNP